jgi:16S rRNA (cytosine967-C5)-methyltransferase
MALKQQAILASAARLVKSGGRLVYATCSLLRAENEAIAEGFADQHPDFEWMPAGPLLSALAGEQAADLCEGPYLRLWPHRHQTDGFFAAVWQRR